MRTTSANAKSSASLKAIITATKKLWRHYHLTYDQTHYVAKEVRRADEVFVAAEQTVSVFEPLPYPNPLYTPRLFIVTLAIEARSPKRRQNFVAPLRTEAHRIGSSSRCRGPMLALLRGLAGASLEMLRGFAFDHGSAKILY